MIKLENYEVMGWEHAIRGMRNPMNSWEKSDSCSAYENCIDCNVRELCDEQIKRGEELAFFVGPNDHELMMKLAKGGPVHAKYRRMIAVYVDITAPLYWWKEFDTYKVGTVANSCSTMHKIHEKEFTMEDFSCEKLFGYPERGNAEAVKTTPLIEDPFDGYYEFCPTYLLELTIEMLNKCRSMFLETNDKKYWWQMIQLLPSSYNQKRTVMLNYEVLAGIYPMRKNHKLDEWREFCQWIETLPYSEIIIGEKEDV